MLPFMPRRMAAAIRGVLLQADFCGLFGLPQDSLYAVEYQVAILSDRQFFLCSEFSARVRPSGWFTVNPSSVHVIASYISLAPPQPAAGLVHSAAPPFPDAPASLGRTGGPGFGRSFPLAGDCACFRSQGGGLGRTV